MAGTGNIKVNEIYKRNFPGSLVVKTSPVRAGVTGLIPGLGRSHTLQATKAPEPQLLEPVSPEPELRNKRNHHSVKPMYHSGE